MNIFFLLGFMGSHNHTCAHHHDLIFDTSLSSSRFCTSRNYYVHHVCYALTHGHADSECEITSFNGDMCVNGICLCFSGNKSVHVDNITLGFHVCLSGALNLSSIPPYFHIRSPKIYEPFDFLSVVFAATGVLISVYFSVLICKLYCKYMGYQKINIVKNVEEEKEKGARTHDLEKSLKDQP
jgi:hypothetical protein